MIWTDAGAALLTAAAAGLDSIILNKTGLAVSPAVASVRRFRGIGGTIPWAGIEEYVLAATEDERRRRIEQDDEDILLML